MTYSEVPYGIEAYIHGDFYRPLAGRDFGSELK